MVEFPDGDGPISWVYLGLATKALNAKLPGWKATSNSELPATLVNQAALIVPFFTQILFWYWF